jgi:hypothetical protein
MAPVDWECAAKSLTESGFARLPALLSPGECSELIALYEQPDLFRSRIDMARYRFGKGEYQYFRYPLPPLVERLRHELYLQLAPVANQWAELLGEAHRFPLELEGLLARCHKKGQKLPTPLMLRYGPGDYNCLHQDLYGAIAFPFQAVLFLSEPERDYSGGEFLLVENPPRAQAMGRAIRPRQGEALVITTRHRPAEGKRGPYRVGVRHGVSPVTAGRRWTLGIIFHDAE